MVNKVILTDKTSWQAWKKFKASQGDDVVQEKLENNQKSKASQGDYDGQHELASRQKLRGINFTITDDQDVAVTEGQDTSIDDAVTTIVHEEVVKIYCHQHIGGQFRSSHIDVMTIHI